MSGRDVLVLLLLPAAGCTLQVDVDGDVTVLGPALVSEVRLVHPGQKRAARVLSVSALGLAPSAGGVRSGLSFGACRDVRFEVYAFDALTPELRAWAGEGLTADGLQFRSARDLVVLAYRSPAPPGATEAARFRGVGILGGGVNLMESELCVAAGWSTSRRLLAEAGAADVAILYAGDGSEVRFLPMEGDR